MCEIQIITYTHSALLFLFVFFLYRLFIVISWRVSTISSLGRSPHWVTPFYLDFIFFFVKYLQHLLLCVMLRLNAPISQWHKQCKSLQYWHLTSTIYSPSARNTPQQFWFNTIDILIVRKNCIWTLLLLLHGHGIIQMSKFTQFHWWNAKEKKNRISYTEIHVTADIWPTGQRHLAKIADRNSSNVFPIGCLQDKIPIQ